MSFSAAAAPAANAVNVCAEAVARWNLANGNAPVETALIDPLETGGYGLDILIGKCTNPLLSNAVGSSGDYFAVGGCGLILFDAENGASAMVGTAVAAGTSANPDPHVRVHAVVPGTVCAGFAVSSGVAVGGL